MADFFLAIDTSTERLLIAVGEKGNIDNTFTYKSSDEKNFKHLETLIPQLDILFKDNNLNLTSVKDVYVCTGPGSFTGMRIGIATARTIALSLNAECHGFSSFDIFAHLMSKNKSTNYLPLIDARKNRFYCALLNNENYRDFEIHDYTIEEISSMLTDNVTLCGKDTEKLEHFLNEKNISYNKAYSDGYSPDDIADFINSNKSNFRSTEPIYIRKSEAEIALLQKQNIQQALDN